MKKEAEPDRRLRPLHTWRSRICGASGPADPVTRHVLLTLSLHMNELGESCFPSIITLAQETALGEKTVRTHLKSAARDGWIIRRVRADGHGAGKGWRRYEYRAGVGEGAVRDTAPSPEHIDNQTFNDKVRSEIPHDQHGAVSDASCCGSSRPFAAVARTDEYSREYPKSSLSGTSYRTTSPKVPDSEDGRHLKRLLTTPDDKLKPVDLAWKRKYLETVKAST